MPEAGTESSFSADPFAPAVDGIGLIADTHLHVRIDVPGRLDAPRLLAALGALRHAVPELAARYQPGFWRARWLPDPEPHWDLEEHHQQTSEDAARVEAALFALPFAPCDDLPLRLRLLHLADHDRLLLRVSHLIADGGGTKNLCYRLAEAYRKVGEDPSWRPAPQRVAHPWVRLLGAFRLARLPWMLWDLLYDIAGNLSGKPMLVPMKPPGPHTCRLADLHVNAERVARLRARWRPRGVTLNDLALSALSRAVITAFPQINASRAKAALVITADMRQYMRSGDDVRNISGLRPLDLGRLPVPEPEAQLDRVVRQTRRWKAGQTGMLMSLCVASLGSLVPHAWIAGFVRLALSGLVARLGGCVALTNIGPIDAERLDFGDGPCLAARVAAPVAHSPMLITALTGCAGALDFTVAYREPLADPADMQRLVRAFDEELTALEGEAMLP